MSFWYIMLTAVPHSNLHLFVLTMRRVFNLKLHPKLKLFMHLNLYVNVVIFATSIYKLKEVVDLQRLSVLESVWVSSVCSVHVVNSCDYTVPCHGEGLCDMFAYKTFYITDLI